MHCYFLLFCALFLPFDLLGIESGTIILLNGPSAVGKSSIQGELQRQMPKLYLKAGIDSFFDALITAPDLSNFQQTNEFFQYTKDGILIRGVRLLKDDEGNQIVPLEIGPAGDKIISGMHFAISAYAYRGNNIVVDYILYKPEWLPDLVSALRGYKVYLIGIKAPLELIEERERKRGTSPIGHARSHFFRVHQGMMYDLELNVAEMPPEESARKIIQFIKDNPEPTALNSLSELFKN